MSFNHVDLYREGFDTYDIICDFIYDFIIIIFLITSQVVIIAWFYKNEQHMSEMSKQIESLKSTMNTNKIISDKNEQSLSEQIESLKTLSLFILFNDNEPTNIDVIKLFDEKDIENLLEYYSCLKYYGFPRLFNVFIKNWLRYATEEQLITVIPKFIKYNYTYHFGSCFDGRTKYYFNDPNFLRYFKDDTVGYGDSEELNERISNAFLHIGN